MNGEQNEHELRVWNQPAPRKVRVKALTLFGMLLLPFLLFPFYRATFMTDVLVLNALASQFIGTSAQGTVASKHLGKDKNRTVYYLRTSYRYGGRLYETQNEVSEEDYAKVMVGELLPLKVAALWPSQLARIEKYTEKQNEEDKAARVISLSTFLWIGLGFGMRNQARHEKKLISTGSFALATVVGKERENDRNGLVMFAFDFNNEHYEVKHPLQSTQIRRREVGEQFLVVFFREEPGKARPVEELNYEPIEK